MNCKPMLSGLCVALAALAHADVDFASLLAELNDRDAITRFPEPSYAMKLWSSAARSDDWFDNRDYDNFCSEYTNKAGVVEKVLVDAKGPGAIVRAWFAGMAHFDATLKIYLDGSNEPLVAGPLRDIAGGTALCGAPLSAVITEATPEVHWRAQNLFLPIPYAKGCRVTAIPGKQHYFYYNIETRRYAEGARVASLTKETLAGARDALAAANAKMADVAGGIAATETKRFDGTLQPGETRTVRFDGPGAIRHISLKSVPHDGQHKPLWRWCQHVLRPLRIELAFDGVTTVKMPVGAFFNAGYWVAEPHATRFTRVANGVLESRWVMPFAKSCELRLTNESDVPVALSDAAISKGAYAVDGRTLRFGATYVARPRQATRVKGKPVDLTFADLKGRGVFAGAAVIVENAMREWWGEGDEKIYVDGEKEPSYIGTGTEDYFCYAWCRPARFSHPLVAQPCGDGNKQGGYTINFRGRALDAIPFTSAFRHDMELWHAADTVVDYDSVAYYYLMP